MKAAISDESIGAKNGQDFDYSSLQIWEVATFPMLTGAWVYHLIREGKVVYVGMTTTGIARVCSHIRDGWKKFDSFRARPCKNGYEASKVEAADIWNFNPEYNTIGAAHPHYIQRSAFIMAKHIQAKKIRLTDFLDSLPSVVRAGTRFWHIRHKYPEGHPKNDVGYWMAKNPELYENVQATQF